MSIRYGQDIYYNHIFIIKRSVLEFKKFKTWHTAGQKYRSLSGVLEVIPCSRLIYISFYSEQFQIYWRLTKLKNKFEGELDLGYIHLWNSYIFFTISFFLSIPFFHLVFQLLHSIQQFQITILVIIFLNFEVFQYRSNLLLVK